jgi:hypothetical protein
VDGFAGDRRDDPGRRRYLFMMVSLPVRRSGAYVIAAILAFGVLQGDRPGSGGPSGAGRCSWRAGSSR